MFNHCIPDLGLVRNPILEVFEQGVAKYLSDIYTFVMDFFYISGVQIIVSIIVPLSNLVSGHNIVQKVTWS